MKNLAAITSPNKINHAILTKKPKFSDFSPRHLLYSDSLIFYYSTKPREIQF